MVDLSARPHLEAVPLFQSLEPAERALLVPLARARAYDRGQTVFSEGEPAADLSFVVIGRVKIVKAARGRDVILGLFGPGEPVGALAALEGVRYPASAVAIEPSTVLHVPEREFFQLVAAHPEMTRRLLQGLVRRQLETASRLADLTGSVDFRVARLFLALGEKVGRRDGAGLEIPLSLSRQEIADLTSTTVETAIRIMSRWGKEGLVVTHPGGFRVPDLQALRGVTGES